MKTNLLILDPHGEEYQKALEPEFPELFIRACKTEEEVGDFIEQARILLTFNISDELIQKAVNLEWIQALGTGVDSIVSLPSLPKGVLVTSTRGIHGPQMSELAILLMLALTRRFPDTVRNQDKAVWDRWPAELLWQKKVGNPRPGRGGRRDRPEVQGLRDDGLWDQSLKETSGCGRSVFWIGWPSHRGPGGRLLHHRGSPHA